MRNFAPVCKVQRKQFFQRVKSLLFSQLRSGWEWISGDQNVNGGKILTFRKPCIKIESISVNFSAHWRWTCAEQVRPSHCSNAGVRCRDGVCHPSPTADWGDGRNLFGLSRISICCCGTVTLKNNKKEGSAIWSFYHVFTLTIFTYPGVITVLGICCTNWEIKFGKSSQIDKIPPDIIFLALKMEKMV